MGSESLVLVAFLVFRTMVSCSESPTPIVLWHGMGDSCCSPWSMGPLISALERHLPDVHVLSIEIGNGLIEDTMNGFLMHPDKQIEMACEAIKSDPALANGYNAIGLSQGSQFLRALAQRCPEPRMKNLATLGGQHQGVYGIPKCNASAETRCDQIRTILTPLAYFGFVQKNLVQATYWHDPLDEIGYGQKNTFLADINNEVEIKQAYVDSLQGLESFVMVKFEEDDMVQPVESQWFGFYEPGQSKVVRALQESTVYDRLGLRKLDEEGKLHFLSVKGNHLQFSTQWLLDNIVDIYFV